MYRIQTFDAVYPLHILKLESKAIGLCIILIHLKPLLPSTKRFHLLIATLFTSTAAIRKFVWRIRFGYANSNLNQNQMWLHLKPQMVLFPLIRPLKVSYSMHSSYKFTKLIMASFSNHLHVFQILILTLTSSQIMCETC